jgi:hypothetical protein
VTETYDKIDHWYGWNGGECPVHPETEIETVFRDGRKTLCKAQHEDWGHDGLRADIIAFRITRLYVEPKVPREWWVNVYEQPGMMTGLYNTEVEANRNAAGKLHTCVLVREVLEPGQ